MKNLKLLVVALVAMFGFIACDKHECNDHDHSADLVGTWTCMEAGFAQAFVFKADGTAITAGVENGEYWEDVQVNWKVENNKLTLSHNDNVTETLLELIPGNLLSITGDKRRVYQYCANDLSDEIIGMWVCNDSFNDEQDMMIQTFYENGKCTLTGYLPQEGGSEQVKNEATDYKVVGDLLFIAIPAEKAGGDKTMYVVDKLIYTPDGTEHGDILTMKTYPEADGEFVEQVLSFLCVKQYLNLDNKVYDYSSAYVSNAKGKDEDFTIGENVFNMATIKAGNFDMMFRSVLSCFEFSANSFTYKFRSNGTDIEFDTPITVDGNKVTLDMSKVNPACRTVDIYMFQDKDDSQLHMYMHTNAFINYFANVDVVDLIARGKISQIDEAAIAKVFADMEARVESINVSFVLKARK